MNSDQIDRVVEAFPGRREHIHLLSKLLDPNLPSPASLFLHDVNSPSHTFSLLKTILQHLILQSNKLNPDPQDRIAPQGSISSSPIRDLPWDPSPNRLLSFNLSPLTHPTPRSICSEILQKLHQTSLNSDDSFSAHPVISTAKVNPSLIPADDSIGAFVRSLRLALDKVDSQGIELNQAGSSSQPRRSQKTKMVVVVRNAERIRDMWHENVCEGLGKLGELLNRQGLVTLILISSIPPSQFRTASGGFNASSTLSSPLIVRFKGIAPNMTLKALHLLFPQLEKSFRIQSLLYPKIEHQKKLSDEAFSAALRQLFEGLCKYVCDTFAAEVRSLNEKEMLTGALWHVLSVMVHLGAAKDLRFSSYATRLSPYGRDALDVLIPRKVGIREWITISRSKMTESILSKNPELRTTLEVFGDSLERESNNLKKGRKRVGDENSIAMVKENEQKRLRAAIAPSTMELPLLPSYLLIAAFLASFLKAGKDPSLFLRSNEGVAGKVKKGGGAKKSKKGGDGEEERDDLKRSSLVGPRPFPLERLLAILQSILSENSPNVDANVGSDMHYNFEFEEDFTQDAEDEEALGEWKAKMEEWSSGDQGEEIWGRKIRSASTLKTISVLISRRLIQRTNASEKLDSMNLRCNIGYSEARALAKRVGFELANYTSSW